MNRFMNEVKIIGKTAWTIAILLYVCLVALLLWLEEFGTEWNVPLSYLFTFGLPVFPSLYALMMGYVYADAKRRGMRPVVWTLLTLLIPNAIGFILYFIMREPLLNVCPQCGKPTHSQFPFCSNCGRNLAPACLSCGRAVESGWSHCPHCGTALNVAPAARTG